MQKNNDIELPLIEKGTKSLSKEGKSSNLNDPLFSEVLNPASSSRKFNKITSYLSYLSFFDMLPLLKAINAAPGAFPREQLPLPYDKFNVQNKIYLLDKTWHEHNVHSDGSQKPMSLIQCLMKVHKKELLANAFNMFIHMNLNIISSILLGQIMRTITSSNLGEEVGMESLVYPTIGFAISYFWTVYYMNWWAVGSWELGSSLRLSITGLIYKKLNTVSLSSLQEISIGKVINLVANDINDIDYGLSHFGPMVTAPYTLALSLYVLWGYFGPYCLISIALQSTILISAAFFSEQSTGPRDDKNMASDQRIKHTNEFIENIRLIKLYAWEKALTKVVLRHRNSEVVAMKKLAVIDSIATVFTESSTYICVLVTCIAYYLGGGVLSAEKVYTSTIILSMSKFWVNFSVQRGLMFIVNIKLMNKRLEEILKVKEIVKAQEKTKDVLLKGDDMILFKNFTAYWNSKTQVPCLKDINTTIKKGQLIALVGKIGSGKTTFLLSFLKEIPVTSGTFLFNGSIAYVEQEPVIFSGSIRDNVLFGKEYDSPFYSKVLRACNLNEDLKQLDHQDQTIVGERGVTLSGGQKARISLARALYARSDIYLLDDPLSAVDSRVGKIIFEKAIKEILKDKTVILVTHHLNYAKEADKVIVLKDGSIETEGSFDQVMKTDNDLFQTFNKENKNENEQKTNETNKPERQIERRRDSFRGSSRLSEGHMMVESEEQIISEEESTLTSKHTYLTYLKESKKYIMAIVTYSFYFSAQLSILFFSKYLGYWAQLQNEAHTLQNSSEVNNAYYITITVTLVLCIIICNFSKMYLTIKFLLDTNSNIHAKMLQKISRTFVAFFDSTPMGNILNRFSNDLGVLDKANTMCVFDILDQGTGLCLFMAYISIMNPVILIPCLLFIAAMFRAKSYFSKPVTELKRLDLISRSPIYSEISSTLGGLLAIRVYNQSARFIDNFLGHIYISSQAFLMYIRSNRLISIVLDGIVYTLILSCISIFIYLAYNSDLEVSLFGLAVYYLVAIANDTTWTIRQVILLDVQMQSAERIQQYCLLSEEAPDYVPSVDSKLKTNKRSHAWPENGQITFKNVYLKYPNTQKFALNGLSFKVEPNCKVGIVGRTGAGKSSIIQILFRIVEIEDLQNSSIEIDGIDTKTIGLETLRGSLSILPQTPVIFCGSIKRNLDPFDELPESKLWEVLEQVNLKDYVQSLENGIHTDMSISSSVFSAGQKQLICLARAILKKSKVVILDEATANVDMTTDSIIQEKINEIFKDCVVLTIAHRLSTIAHYDKILVLDKGKMVEYDHPYKLLVEKDVDMSITNKEGVFAGMVLKNGEKVAQEIFNKALESYKVLMK